MACGLHRSAPHKDRLYSGKIFEGKQSPVSNLLSEYASYPNGFRVESVLF